MMLLLLVFIIIILLLYFLSNKKKCTHCHNKHSNKKIEDNQYSNTNVREEFIESKTFKGAKNGYVFKTNEKGTGYYLDNN